MEGSLELLRIPSTLGDWECQAYRLFKITNIIFGGVSLQVEKIEGLENKDNLDVSHVFIEHEVKLGKVYVTFERKAIIQLVTKLSVPRGEVTKDGTDEIV